MYIASNHRYPSDDLIRLLTVLFNGHVVRELGYAFFRKKARKQDICIGQIKLTYPHICELGSNVKSPAPLIIKERSKHCRGIEVRVTKKIERAVHAHQCNRLHVPDDAVIFNWFEGHMIRYNCVITGRRPSFIEQTSKTQAETRVCAP